MNNNKLKREYPHIRDNYTKEDLHPHGFVSEEVVKTYNEFMRLLKESITEDCADSTLPNVCQMASTEQGFKKIAKMVYAHVQKMPDSDIHSALSTIDSQLG